MTFIDTFMENISKYLYYQVYTLFLCANIIPAEGTEVLHFSLVGMQMKCKWYLAFLDLLIYGELHIRVGVVLPLCKLQCTKKKSTLTQNP